MGYESIYSRAKVKMALRAPLENPASSPEILEKVVSTCLSGVCVEVSQHRS
jgi:hypothetical protein